MSNRRSFWLSIATRLEQMGLHCGPLFAVSFVQEHGSPVDKLVLQQLSRLAPLEARMRWFRGLERLQNPDGGLSLNLAPGHPSSLNITLFSLTQLEYLDLLDEGADFVSGAVEFIISRQSETDETDGSFSENSQLPSESVPAWATPGDLHATAYLTALASWWLLRLRPMEAADSLRRALSYLNLHQGQDGRLPGFWHSTWLATGAAALASDTGSTAAAAGLGALRARPDDDWDPGQAGWALNCLLASGFGVRDVLWLARIICRKQGLTGGWSSEDGDEWAPWSTAQCLRGLKLLVDQTDTIG